MAVYRTISLTFWDDNKIVDDFTPEDKYFYLYLLTNPHTNIVGCYEISLKQMSYETGYNIEIIQKLIDRMQTIHKVIIYSKNTKELLVKNWYKYNWTKSSKLIKNIKTTSNNIKDNDLKNIVLDIVNNYEKDTVCIGYPYRMHTTDPDPVTDKDQTIDRSLSLSFINNIYSYVEENFGRMLSPIEYEEISKWEDNELTRYAIKEAVLKGKYNIKYISQILYNYKKNSIITVQQAQEDTKRYKEQHRYKTSNDRANEVYERFLAKGDS